MKLMIDIDDKDFHRVCQGYIDYSNTLDGRCLAAISEGTPISDNVTNGDVLKAMFPNIVVEEQSKDLFIVFNMDFQGTPFYKVWWNAPYQKGGKE